MPGSRWYGCAGSKTPCTRWETEHFDLVPLDLGLPGEHEGLVSMLDNFIDNAIKYSPPGSTVHLAVGAHGRACAAHGEQPGRPPAGVPSMTWPRRRSTTDLTMDRPSPLPEADWACMRKKRSNTRPCHCTAMPGP